MPKFFKVASVIATLLGLWLIVEIIFTVREVRDTTLYVKQTISDTSAQIDPILQRLGRASDAIATMADEQRATSKKTAENIEKMTRKSGDVLERLDTTIAKVNNETIPQFNKTLETANIQLKNTGEEAANTLAVTRKGLEATLTETTRVANSLNDVVSNPNIKQSLQNMAEASKEAADGMKQWKGVGEDTHEMTTDLKKAVKRATKPVPWIVSGLSWAWRRVYEIFSAKAGGL